MENDITISKLEVISRDELFVIIPDREIVEKLFSYIEKQRRKRDEAWI